MWWLFYRISIIIILYQTVFNLKIDYPINLSNEFYLLTFFYMNLNFFSESNLDSEVIICFSKIYKFSLEKGWNSADHHSYIVYSRMERLSQQIPACNDKLSLLHITKKYHH